MYSWEFLGIPRNSKSSQNWSLPFPEIPSNSKLFKSELICMVGNFWEFLGVPRNSQKTGNSVGKGYLHNGNFWEFLGIHRKLGIPFTRVRIKWLLLWPYIAPSLHNYVDNCSKNTNFSFLQKQRHVGNMLLLYFYCKEFLFM